MVADDILYVINNAPAGEENPFKIVVPAALKSKILDLGHASLVILVPRRQGSISKHTSILARYWQTTASRADSAWHSTATREMYSHSNQYQWLPNHGASWQWTSSVH